MEAAMRAWLAVSIRKTSIEGQAFTAALPTPANLHHCRHLGNADESSISQTQKFFGKQNYTIFYYHSNHRHISLFSNTPEEPIFQHSINITKECYNCFLRCINVCVSVALESFDIKRKKKKSTDESFVTQSRYLKFLILKDIYQI